MTISIVGPVISEVSYTIVGGAFAPPTFSFAPPTFFRFDGFLESKQICLLQARKPIDFDDFLASRYLYSCFSVYPMSTSVDMRFCPNFFGKAPPMDPWN